MREIGIPPSRGLDGVLHLLIGFGPRPGECDRGIGPAGFRRYSPQVLGKVHLRHLARRKVTFQVPVASVALPGRARYASLPQPCRSGFPRPRSSTAGGGASISSLMARLLASMLFGDGVGATILAVTGPRFGITTMRHHPHQQADQKRGGGAERRRRNKKPDIEEDRDVDAGQPARSERRVSGRPASVEDAP